MYVPLSHSTSNKVLYLYLYNEVEINLYMIENIIEYMTDFENYQSMESYDII